LLYFRGPPKKKQKKASTSNTVTSIVVATTGSGMVFPHNEAVANATQKPKRVKKSAKKKGPPATTSTNRLIFYFSRSCHLQPITLLIFFPFHTRSATGSNDPFPPQIEHPPTVHEDIASYEVQTPRKKQAVMKKCTPKRAPVEVTNPSSPASNTRSKKRLHLE
jgi:hypothetical protein